ncbi:MAG: hypothetical protein NDI61_13420, partial [Bdellovibrionaceae bacterium]|nr:hypothetical protein [Pseudobdellovibrionaceae bacterium]
NWPLNFEAPIFFLPLSRCTTSAHIGTYHFHAGLWLVASHYQIVAFRSSLLAFVSRVAVR